MLETEEINEKIFEVATPPVWQPQNDVVSGTLSRAPLSAPQSYYRSKVYTVQLGINPLIAAASTLFSLTSKLRESESYTDINGLYQQLSHEIKAFENNAQAQNYRSDIILVARYVLCALLDETILNTSWGKISNWERHKLLVTFHSEQNGDDRFFAILDRIIEDPALHIDLLEMLYLCLNYGFEGKYRYQENGKAMLDTIIDRLFERIRFQRGDIKKDFTTLHKTTTQTKTIQIQKKAHTPIWLIITSMCAAMMMVYGGFNYLLSNDISRIYQQLESVQHTTVASSNTLD
jgi:type VI secretion system protein ImpK